MKKLIHLLCVLLAVCMLPVCAWAEESLAIFLSAAEYLSLEISKSSSQFKSSCKLILLAI